MPLKKLSDDQNQFRDLILTAVKVEKLLAAFPDLFRQYVAEAGKSPNVSAQTMERVGKRKASTYIENRLKPVVDDFLQGVLPRFQSGVRHVNQAYQIELRQSDSIEDFAQPSEPKVIQAIKTGKSDPVLSAVNTALSKEFVALAGELLEVCSVLEVSLRSDRTRELAIDGSMFSRLSGSLDPLFEHISQMSKDYPLIFEGMFSLHQEAAFSRG